MFNKLDGILAVVAVLIVVHLFGAYSEYIPTDQDGNPEVAQQVPEETESEDTFFEDDTVADDEYQEANGKGLSEDVLSEQSINEEEEHAAEDERIAQEKREEQAEADQETERIRQQASSTANRSISADMYDRLTASMAGDPYISDRYMMVVVDSANHIVEVSVDETTFGSLDVDLKATAFEAISQEVQQHYLDLLAEFSSEQPEEVIVELQDSNRQLLSTYKKDSFGDRYVLSMEHTNDNNF